MAPATQCRVRPHWMASCNAALDFRCDSSSTMPQRRCPRIPVMNGAGHEMDVGVSSNPAPLQAVHVVYGVFGCPALVAGPASAGAA
jgi:hypothetical protein